MKRDIARAGAFLSLVAGAALLVPACADNESSMFIRGALVPDNACLVTASGTTSVIKAAGHMDVYANAAGPAFTQYESALLVGSQIVLRGDGDKLRSETSRVRIDAADVTIEDLTGAVISAYEVPTQGFIDPSDGQNPGYGIANVLLIDATTTDLVRAQLKDTTNQLELVSKVILRGTTLGGDEIESGEWQFPITFCWGCLIYPGQPAGSCVGAAADDLVCNVCSLGTDAGLDCHCLE